MLSFIQTCLLGSAEPLFLTQVELKVSQGNNETNNVGGVVSSSVLDGTNAPYLAYILGMVWESGAGQRRRRVEFHPTLFLLRG